MGTNGSYHQNQKIDEALELLNEAAREKKEELRSLLTNKYSHIKEAFSEVAADGGDILEGLKKKAEEAYEEGEAEVRRAIEDIDTDARKNPWIYIGGAAVGGLLLGYFLARSRR